MFINIARCCKIVIMLSDNIIVIWKSCGYQPQLIVKVLSFELTGEIHIDNRRKKSQTNIILFESVLYKNIIKLDYNSRSKAMKRRAKNMSTISKAGTSAVTKRDIFPLSQIFSVYAIH